MSDRPSKEWTKRFAQVPNDWLLACARLGLTGTEWSVLAYVVARTTGDWDARRGSFGRPWARISSREIGEHIAVDPANVRRALDSLVARKCLRRVRRASGRRPAAIGPEALLTAVRQADADDVESSSINLADALAGLSPELRRHAEAFCGVRPTPEAQPCRGAHAYASEDESPSVAV